ncbi:MAG: fimbria/pilus outer membrane usher protein [Pseudomonadota bacterium]|nr:fimbria/pilus outer membrane usher protein [Pseudomonadota bacterium]
MGTLPSLSLTARLPALFLVYLVGFLAAGLAQGADAPLLAVPNAATAPGELYLDVNVNGRSAGAVMRFMQTGSSLRASAADLLTLGIDPALGANARQDEYDLNAVNGLRYRFDAATQSVTLDADDTVRTPFVVETRPARSFGTGSATPGAVLNYELYSRLGSGAQGSVLSEARWFNGSGVFSSTALATISSANRKALRYDTSWTYADPATLTSVQAGDFISRSVPWSRSIRMGGIEWRKNFDLRPDMLTYPVPELKGSAVVPSSVALYVNQMKQYSGAVPDGPFVLNQVAGLNGAGLATVVTRDALGRDVATSIPLYIDTRLLAAGFDDAAFGAGFVRRGYGERSFAYAPQLAVTGSLRHGWSDSVTLEAHAEASAEVANGGAGVLVRFGQLGVLNAALAVSRAFGTVHARGAQASVGYQYLAPRFAIDIQSMRASAQHTDLGTLEGTPIARANDRATVNMAMSAAQNVSLSYVGVRQGTATRNAARIAAVAWGMQIARGVSLNVNAFRDLDNARARGMSATLSIALPGRMGASASAGSQSGAKSHALSLARAGEVAVSPTWSIQQGGQAGSQYAQAQVQYTGSTAQYSGQLQRDGGAVHAALGMSGSIVAMNDRVLPARQTGAAFALVSTGLPNVMVLQENRAIGRTDSRGDLLVPDLVPYAVNRLGIDPDELPAEAMVAISTMEVVPQRLSGVLATLPVTRYDGATVTVVDAAGKPLPSGAAVAFGSGDAPSIVGYDGMVFVAHVKAHNTLTLQWMPELEAGAANAARAQRCTATFNYDSATHAPGAALPPVLCQPEKEATP